MKILKILVLFLLFLPVLVLLLGQLGLYTGKTPEGLGVREGKLKPPRATPNSVSSQTSFYPDHLQHQGAQIAALQFQGDGAAAMKRLQDLVAGQPGHRLVKAESNYLYFEARSQWLKFVDDLEFSLDDSAKLIHVRSASRLGRKDLGVNRARVEAIRARFATS